MDTFVRDFLQTPLDANAEAPLYQQLQDKLRQALEGGDLKPSDALPNERSLASSLNVSRVTVRKAIEGLVSEGLLVRRQGAGTFVGERIEKNFSKLSSFSEDLEARGLGPSSKILQDEITTATSEEAFSLGLPLAGRVRRIHRLRFADNTPLAVEYAVVPPDVLAQPAPMTASLYTALNETGSRPVRALQRLRAVGFSAEIAELLEVPAGEPGLLIERRGFLASGRAVEFTTSYYRGDAYDFVTELSTTDDPDAKNKPGFPW